MKLGSTRLKSRWAHRESHRFLTSLLAKITGGKEETKPNYDLQENIEDVDELYTYKLQQALDKSYPYHDSDLPGIIPSPPGTFSQFQVTYPHEECFSKNKIRIDPLSNMVYFDDSPSRRAFSLIRTTDAQNGAKIKRSGMSVKHPKKYQTTSSCKASLERRISSPLQSGISSGSTNCSGVSMGAKSVLRSKVNANSAQEKERLKVQQEERQQRWAAKQMVGRDDLSSDGSVPRERQYPRGTRSSVKELYSVMRQAQVAEYCMNYNQQYIV